ncbi:unnamed protein product [Musa acuminata subsp. malaccensis]|uniref:(wild Malaysian banana) hypothetical protein n=1 Tax=Musa acuminata subsp. malaccensis TaxID=214687 RepID=A0A804KBG0_MUSAM|nr:unnamed protein product [Musa acuminata subsp. malaccensis]
MRECHNNNKQKDCVSCHTCGNINWAKCMKCNICNTNKSGHSECGVSMLEMQLLMVIKQANKHVCSFGFSHIGLLDDGEIYDEFGNLKKKFHAKTQQAESGQMVPGSGRAGWEVDEIVMTGRHGMDKSRDSNKRESSKNREIDGPERERR